MGELAVLHNPDQLLSGPQGPSLVGGVVALGDRVTNSAVGAQTAQGPRELIRDAAQGRWMRVRGTGCCGCGWC